MWRGRTSSPPRQDNRVYKRIQSRYSGSFRCLYVTDIGFANFNFLQQAEFFFMTCKNAERERKKQDRGNQGNLVFSQVGFCLLNTCIFIFMLRTGLHHPQDYQCQLLLLFYTSLHLIYTNHSPLRRGFNNASQLV